MLRFFVGLLVTFINVVNLKSNLSIKIFIFFLISLIGFRCGTNNTSTFYRSEQKDVLYIKLERGFTPEERISIIETFNTFRTLGLRPRLVESRSDLVYDLKVENTELGLLETDLGRHMGLNVIRLATNRMINGHQLKMVFMHEVGHWLGMHHVCIGSEPEERINECSPVGIGTAIMNPFNNPAMPAEFTALDSLEYHRSQTN